MRFAVAHLTHPSKRNFVVPAATCGVIKLLRGKTAEAHQQRMARDDHSKANCPANHRNIRVASYWFFIRARSSPCHMAVKE